MRKSSEFRKAHFSSVSVNTRQPAVRALVGKEHEHVGLVVLGAGLIIVVFSSKEEGT